VKRAGGYDHAIREFIEWSCSEPRLAFNKTVVTRYRIALEQKHYAPSTINLRLAGPATGLRSVRQRATKPRLGRRIRRVKGVRRLGVRIGNWLTAEESRRLLSEREQANCSIISPSKILRISITTTANGPSDCEALRSLGGGSKFLVLAHLWAAFSPPPKTNPTPIMKWFLPMTHGGGSSAVIRTLLDGQSA